LLFELEWKLVVHGAPTASTNAQQSGRVERQGRVLRETLSLWSYYLHKVAQDLVEYFVQELLLLLVMDVLFKLIFQFMV
jgi:hypothetical protein